ncbi:MAG TPA: AAC(3)-I family aminoglycoside N-acetyltransferase [Sphingomicrobium sp.]|jgi:aminoglycoside 3-N-acetyltransferase I|nr:AAC(3)-I family aminoglycoside N-acetyltransferase [Sphingomicrobium sp.]
MIARVHRLGSEDERLFRGMNELFADVFEDRETYLSASPGPRYVAELLADSSFVALVALSDDRIVGALTAYRLRKPEQERSELYIYDLGVVASARRQGVATALIDWLRGHAAEIGAWVVYVQADPPDTPAVALYSKLGVREDVLHFDIPPLLTR